MAAPSIKSSQVKSNNFIGQNNIVFLVLINTVVVREEHDNLLYIQTIITKI